MTNEYSVRELSDQIRAMRQEIKMLKAQTSLNKLANASIYQAVSNQTIQAPTIRNPTIEGTASGGTWTNVNNISTDRVTFNNDDGDNVEFTVDGSSGNEVIVLDKGGLSIPDYIKSPKTTITNADGDDVDLTAAGATPVLTCPVDFELSAGKTVTAPNLKASTQIEVVNPDGDNPTITAAGAGAAAGIVTNKNFSCVNGLFGANSVQIGDQVLSEDGRLIISDPATPGLTLKDTGNTFPNTSHLFSFQDDEGMGVFGVDHSDNQTSIFAAGADNYLRIRTVDATDPPIRFEINNVPQVSITNGTLEPETDNDIDLGTTTKEFKDLFLDGTAHIDTLDIDETASITTSIQVAGGAVITTLGDTAALADSDVKIPTNTTVKEYADKKLEADDSSYVHRVSAPFANRNDSSNGSNITSGSAGTYLVTTGTGYLLFVLEPPEWMIKYAADNSLTITVTTITVNWDNTVSADYITQFRVWHSDYNSATVTALINDTTNYGQGSTGFRNDVFDITDKALVAGEWLTVLINTVQGTAYSERIVSFETTYTMT